MHFLCQNKQTNVLILLPFVEQFKSRYLCYFLPLGTPISPSKRVVPFRTSDLPALCCAVILHAEMSIRYAVTHMGVRRGGGKGGGHMPPGSL